LVVSGRYAFGMERTAPDPAKLLEAWMEWERGETAPGRVMSNLKTAGLRDLLEGLTEGTTRVKVAVADSGAAAAWTPSV